MLDDANAFSKVEFQRAECGNKQQLRESSAAVVAQTEPRVARPPRVDNWQQTSSGHWTRVVWTENLCVSELRDALDMWRPLMNSFVVMLGHFFLCAVPDRPQWKQLRSCRLRQRQKRRLQTWRAARSITISLNGLDSGDISNKLTSSCSRPDRQVKCAAARHLASMGFLRPNGTCPPLSLKRA